KELELEFRAARARLLTMMVYGPYWAEEAQPNSVQELVARTGGSTFAINPEAPAWVDAKNRGTTEMIRGFWNERVLTTDVIQVQVPRTLKKEAKLKLTVNA